MLPNFLGKKYYYVLSVPWSVGILYWCLLARDRASDARVQSFSLAIYSLWLWSWAVLAVLWLKKWSKRLRPCLKFSRDYIKENKSFASIPIMLSNTQVDEAFPSGDAATAVAIAVPLAYIESSTQFSFLGHNFTSTMMAAYTITLLSCSGRVYFLAHHVADVTIGVLISYWIHLASSSVGLGVYDMKWWYPLAANVFVAANVKFNMKRLLNMEGKKVKV